MAATSTELVIGNQIKLWVPRFADAAWWGSDATEPGARVLAFIQAAERSHTVAAFVTSAIYTDAMACWALHWLILQEREEATAFGANVAGPITSIRTGDESIGFQQSAMSVGGGGPSDVQYKETSWGKRYLSYRDTRPDAHLFVI